jgi:uncharacterized protein (DUF111 family)
VPNICRAIVGTVARTAPDIASESILALETNIDDQTPEGIGHAIERLISAGALDAWVTPIVMKKSRPAFQLSVLAHVADEARVLEVIFRETTTLGVRRRETQRWVLNRDEIVVEVAGQCVRVKVALLHGDVVGANPEFDDCVRASKESGWSVKDTYAAAAEAARAALRVLD